MDLHERIIRVPPGTPRLGLSELDNRRCAVAAGRMEEQKGRKRSALSEIREASSRARRESAPVEEAPEKEEEEEEKEEAGAASNKENGVPPHRTGTIRNYFAGGRHMLKPSAKEQKEETPHRDGSVVEAGSEAAMDEEQPHQGSDSKGKCKEQGQEQGQNEDEDDSGYESSSSWGSTDEEEEREADLKRREAINKTHWTKDWCDWCHAAPGDDEADCYRCTEHIEKEAKEYEDSMNDCDQCDGFGWHPKTGDACWFCEEGRENGGRGGIFMASGEDDDDY